MANNIIYRTYSDYSFKDHKFVKLSGSFVNKPRGGLWGCRNDEWYQWCEGEDFPCSDKYFEWQLKDDVKVFVIDSITTFCYLTIKYHSNEKSMATIDYKLLQADGYGAVELTPEANSELHLGFLGMGMGMSTSDFTKKNMYIREVMENKTYRIISTAGVNSWDVPSINVFDPENSVVEVVRCH